MTPKIEIECRYCHCTKSKPCYGGCYRVSLDVCSECAHIEKQQSKEEDEE